MKKTKHLLRGKSLLFALLLAISVSAITYYNAKPAYADCTDCVCGIEDEVCINYLIARGYTNVTLIRYEGCDRYCDTQNSYNTTVHVSNGIITGWDDDPH